MSSRFLIRVVAVSALLLIAFFFLIPSAIAANGEFPFQPGEKMSFIFRWNVFEGGTGVMEVLPFTHVKGVEAYHFAMTAKSNSFIDLFYKARDRYESYTDMNLTHSLLYKERKKGSEKRDIMVTFDWDKGKAQYVNFGKAKEPITILPGSFDPLSVYYAFRLIDLEVGKIIEIPVTDGKKSVMGRARVTKRETIKVKGKEFDTYRIQPYLEHFGGVFKKSKKAKLDIWLTADEKKIPVRMRVKVIIGSVTFECIMPEDAEKGEPAS
ncbi:MAG: DUF3108 domain-containing protein [Thermodesulfobacteriota bacterium]|nr:DUF3108 domain-containing protein [Thermodesulfobacteriota bacterium]